MKLLYFVILFAYCGGIFSANINITSPPFTNWGEWGPLDHCPSGKMAQGFQLRTQPNQFLEDDTGLNTIRLFCGDPYREDTKVITSIPGQFGDWGSVYTCFPGVLNGFQLRSESNRGENGDDTAANNIRFFCSSLSNPNDFIEGDGNSWGDWTQAQRCGNNKGICAIQTQMDPYQADGKELNVIIGKGHSCH
ncbi:Vitelline membrane outer layer protein 1 [Orchesella cincta]|uniref:Vitelline membrane outer layer protein 1 n=1 Tax=Orchesella cincta TaxID=48709 RepID=A0A1D2M789_ORCCI|nr:Vitelline membrane outer layer protein 1 [Orchesella cincta]